MAWSVLQSNSSTNAGSGNGTVAFTTANLSAGTKIICLVVVDFSAGGNPVTSVKDGALNALTLLQSISSSSCFTGLYAMDTPAGDVGTKPTLTATVTTNFGVSMIADEVSGLLAGNTTAMIDGAGATASGAASPATTGAYSTAAASEFLYFGYGDPGFSRTVSLPTSGYTANSSEQNAGTLATAYVAYKNSTGGAESASAVLSGAANWQTILVAFKLAAAGASQTPYFRPTPPGHRSPQAWGKLTVTRQSQPGPPQPGVTTDPHALVPPGRGSPHSWGLLITQRPGSAIPQTGDFYQATYPWTYGGVPPQNPVQPTPAPIPPGRGSPQAWAELSWSWQSGAVLPPAVVPAMVRRAPSRLPALAAVRRGHVTFVVPPQVNPPFVRPQITQHREPPVPKAMPRRGRQWTTVPAQLNPPYPFAEISQHREQWPRGFARRGRQQAAVPPQDAPLAETRQWRQPRLFPTRRGRTFAPVPAQVSVTAPSWVPQPLRHARIVTALRRRQPAVPVPSPDLLPQAARRTRPQVPPRRGRGFTPVPPQQAASLNPAITFQNPKHLRMVFQPRGRQFTPVPAQQAAPVAVFVPQAQRRARIMAAPRRGKVTVAPHGQAHVPLSVRPAPRRPVPVRRGRVAAVVPAQVAAANPAWVQGHRGPLRAIAFIRRRWHDLMPWPQAVAPAFTIGTLTAATAARTTLGATDAADSALTAATAASAAITTGTSITGGPS